MRRLLNTALLLVGLLIAAACAASAPASLDELAARYHLKIDAADRPFAVAISFGAITGGAPLSGDLEDYSYLLLDEFGLYPPLLVAQTHLTRIVLCSHLAFAGQPRNAVPDFVHHTLYLKTSRPVRSAATTPTPRFTAASSIHHEFFHVVDNKMGLLYHDAEWEKLNPVDFHYGKDSPRLVEEGLPQTSAHPWFGPGFISVFAMNAVEEDKAETYAYLMVMCVGRSTWRKAIRFCRPRSP